MQGWFNVQKAVNIINCNNKGQNPHDHLNRYRKSLKKIKHSFMIKTLNKLGIEKNFVNLIEPMKTYLQITSYLIVNDLKFPF